MIAADQKQTVFDRIELYSNQHPDRTEYPISTEEEAAEILLSLAALFKQYAKKPGLDRDTKARMKKWGQQYRAAVAQRKALEFVFTRTGEEIIELHDLTIVVEPVKEKFDPWLWLYSRIRGAVN